MRGLSWLKQINKILLIFVIAVSSFVFGGWQFIQTETFAAFVSNKITKKLEDRFNLKLEFTNLKVQLFPPATIFKNSRIKNKRNKKFNAYEINVGEVGFYFGLLSFFSNKISIDKISLTDGYLKIKNVGGDSIRSKKLFKSKFDTAQEVFGLYRLNVFEKFPVKVKGLEFNNLRVYINADQANVKNLSVGLYREAISLIGKIENISLQNKLINFHHFDSLDINSQFQKNKIRFINLHIKEKFNSLKYTGDFNFSKAHDLNGVVTIQGLAKSFFHKYNLTKDLNFDGEFFVESEVKGSIKDLQLQFKLELKNFVSEYALVDKIKLSGRKIKGDIFLDFLKASVNKGTVTVDSSFKIYNINKNFLFPDKIKINTDNLFTNDMLFFLPSLHGLKSRITGDVFLYREKNDFIFEVIKELEIKNFSLLANGGRGQPILQNKGFKLNSSFFRILDNGTVNMDLTITTEKSKIDVKGFVNSLQLNFRSKNAFLDLKEFGPISNVFLEGEGKIPFEITGPLDDVRFYFVPELNNFKLLDLNFGNIKSDIEFKIEDSSLKINRLIGRNGETNYIGKGEINFSGKTDMDIKLSFPKATYKDSAYMYESLIKSFPINVKNIGQYYSANYRITGPLNVREMAVEGEFNANNVNVFTEELDNVSGDFKFINSNIILENLRCTKGLASLVGSYQYNLQNEYFEYDASIKRLELSSIKLYKDWGLSYNGEIIAGFYGSGTSDDYSLKSQIDVKNSNIRNIPVKNASLTIFNTKDEVFLNGQFLGDEFFVDSYLNLNESKNKKDSFFNAWVNTENGRILTALYSDHNIDDSSIRGNFTGSLKSHFSLLNIERGNYSLEINRFKMKKDEFELVLNKGFNKIEIVKGEIKKWDLRFGHKDNFMKSFGVGRLFDNFDVKNNFHIRSNILETLSRWLINSRGSLKGNLDFKKINNELKLSAHGYASDVSFYVKKLKRSVEDLNIEIILDDQDVFIETFEGKFGNGRFNFSGDMKLGFPHPTANLLFELEKSEIPILKKSSVVVSGKGYLTGRRAPYLFKGSFSILHGEIRDELNDLIKGNRTSYSQSRFIPDTKDRDNLTLLRYDVDVNFFRPIWAKNSLLDLKLDGNLGVKGDLISPLLKGNLSTIPGSSKFTFKGHEFTIIEGNVAFLDDKSKKPPFIDFVGVTKINEYTVKFMISGEASKLNIELSSEPILAQQDILSLLTLGVTSEISKNLENSDLESVTSIGIGTLLLDQFKVNQGLNQSLGLRLSVSPEFESDNTSLIQGREGVAGASATKWRSTTKIKLQKKISSKVDLSVSSTVGGDIAQKQEMNINYNINKNVSIQGVYEVKTSNESETNENPDSVGADVKFRWSFK